MRIFYTAALFLAACTAAEAKPPVVKPPVVVPLEFVDHKDAEAALEVARALEVAKADLQIRDLVWQRERVKFLEKYGVDIVAQGGHVWDVDANGRLKVYREPAPKSSKK